MILIALDGYKNYASSETLGKYIIRGINKVNNSHNILLDNMSDGGEGTLEKFRKFKDFKILNFTNINALGSQVSARVGKYVDRNKVSYVFETFQTAGFGYLSPKKYNTLHTSSFGTGKIIDKILKKNPDEIIIGLGGSIVSDGGIGLGSALGVKYLDQNNKTIEPNNKYFSCIDLKRVHSMDVSSLKFNKKCKIKILSDVNTPLLGKKGQAQTFGPQKGANSSDIQFIEKSMIHWNKVLKKTYNKSFNLPYSGASGGMGAGLKAFLNAELFSGSDFIIKKSDLSRKIKNSKFIILGEGKFDKSSLLNKGAFALAKLAKKEKKIVIGVFGSINCDKKIINSLFDYMIDISVLAKNNKVEKNYYKNKKNFFLFKIAGELIGNKLREYE